jgi:mannose-6-phosphate isomerase
VYRTSVPEFELSRIELAARDEVRLDGGRPRILLCTEGALRVGPSLTLRRGESVWVPASDPELVLRGADSGDTAPAQAYLATVGTV